MKDTKWIYLGMGLLVFAGSALALYGSMKLRYYTSLGPGPGFFPVWISSGLMILSALMVGKAALGPAEPAEDDLLPDRAGLCRVLALLAALTGFALLLDSLGYLLASLGLIVLVMLILGERAALRIAATAISISLLSSYLFSNLLKLPMPEGLFGF